VWTPSSEQAEGWIKVRELALEQMNRFISLGPKVLKGNKPDAVHDMRVASRRLQQLLDLLYPAPPKEIRGLRRRIRACRRALSEVRNCDVQLQRARKSVGSKRASRRETWEAVRDYLVERRSESFSKSLRKLGKLNLAVAYVKLKEHLDSNDGAGEDGHDSGPSERRLLSAEPVSESLHARLAAALEKVWQDYESRVAEWNRRGDARVLHGVRISIKRLRYLVEVAHECDVAGSAEVLNWLRNLQGLLGDWHDLEVLEQMLVEMVARPKFLRNHLDIAMGAERLILRNRTAKQRYVAKYLQMTLDSEESQRLKRWVRNLLASGSPAPRSGVA
jgi:CHAD domain-containing protein